MSDYHRDRRDRGNGEGSGISWPLIVIAFCVFWPVGIFLLILKLSQDAKFQQHKEDWVNALNNQDIPFAQRQEEAAQRQAERQAARRARYSHAHEWAQAQPQSVPKADTQPKSTAQPKAAPTAEEKIRKQAQQQAQRRTEQQKRKAPRSNRRSPSTLKKGTALSIVGGIIAVLFGMVTCNQLLEWLTIDIWYAIQQSIVPFFLTGIGGGLFAWGRFKHRQSKRLRRMLTMIGKQTVIDIRQLADAMGSSYGKTCDDIQELIDGGYLGDTAYINMATGQLFLDTDGFQSVVKEKAPKKEETPDQDAQLLAEIRQLDEDIDDEEMSRKIRRIEECTEHILEYQKKHPDKASELHTFLDYYLPTTMKLLHAYAELEDQGVEGDNIATTKARIESTMDSVVQGFEAQLDKLFEGSMLDISADISVMEKMLSRDGLAGGMKMPKAPTEPESPAQSVPYTPTLTLDPNGDSAAAVQTMPEEEGQV